MYICVHISRHLHESTHSFYAQVCICLWMQGTYLHVSSFAAQNARWIDELQMAISLSMELWDMIGIQTPVLDAVRTTDAQWMQGISHRARGAYHRAVLFSVDCHLYQRHVREIMSWLPNQAYTQEPRKSSSALYICFFLPPSFFTRRTYPNKHFEYL